LEASEYNSESMGRPPTSNFGVSTHGSVKWYQSSTGSRCRRVYICT